jgi:hypothetical protein
MQHHLRPRRARASQLAALLVAILATVALVGCGSDKGTSATNTDSTERVATPGTAAISSDGLSSDSPSSDSPSTGASDDSAVSSDDSALPDACADLDAAKVAKLVGFQVTQQPSNTNNTIRSCSFKNEAFDPPFGGAQVTVTIDDGASSVDEIHDTVADMTKDVEPVKVDLGDGGWYVSETGFVELRFLIDGHQVGVNIVAPFADETTGDFSGQAQEVAKVVEQTLS